MALVSFLLLLLPFHLLLLRADSECSNSSFRCGNISMEFPFTNTTNPGCGLIRVDGCDSKNPNISGSAGLRYTILEKINPYKFYVRDTLLQQLLYSRSCHSFRNLSMPQLDPVSFTFSPIITLFKCFNQTHDERIQGCFRNYRSHLVNTSDCQLEVTTVYFGNSTADLSEMEETGIPTQCSMIQLPAVSPDADSDDLFSRLSPDFTLEWSVPRGCSRRGNVYHCREGNTKLKRILFVGGLTTAALASALLIPFVFIWRKRTKEKQEHEKDIELFLKNIGNFAPIRYKYSSIKRMTKSFSENLGKGGHGSVCKGQFPDGRLVAVKILNESKGNGEEFMNEVASISRTSHINVVTLLGFCFERSKRALIYEFMPNGSLDKFIQDTASSPAEGGLGQQKMFEIALGIARGLEYLHQGCNTRILHFDIKPHNILLDKDFNPRISDFGLAKLCPNRSSIVSMLVTRGTAGYIAPEVFSRNFGDVSYKSDVYSYGMMVLEMAGGRENINRQDVDRTSETYFPNYIYKQLDEMNAESNGYLDGIVNEDEDQLAKRKLVIVGLWCIQTNPKDRPSMTKVVEMLEGELETLQIPPKPYLFLSPRISTSESM